MKKTNRKGFTLVELVIVIAVIAILAGVLIATFASVIKRANQSAEVQNIKNAEIAQKADDIIAKIENSNWLGWDDFEASIVAKISEVVKGTDTEHLSESQVKAIVDDAVTTILANRDEGNTGVSEDQIKTIVENALGTLKYEGVNEAQVRAIVNAATTSLLGNQLSAAQVRSIVTAANEKNLAAADIIIALNRNGKLAQNVDITTAVSNVETAITTAAGNLATSTQVEELKGLIEQATENFAAAELNDVVLAKGLNIKLAKSNKVIKTPYDVVVAVEQANPVNGVSSDNLVLLDLANETFIVVEESSKKVLYAENITVGTTLSDTYKYWTFKQTLDASESTYSVYLLDESATTTADLVGVGLDVGTNTCMSSVNYSGSTVAPLNREVVIRTNSFDTTLTVNAPKDTVKHFGDAKKVDVIAVAHASYHENGTVQLIAVKEGHVKLEGKADVNGVYVYTDNALAGFEDIKITVDVGVDIPKLSRSAVEVQDGGTKVCTVVTDQAKDIYLFNEGIYEQIKAIDHIDSADYQTESAYETAVATALAASAWIDETDSGASANTQTAAQQLANEFNGSYDGNGKIADQVVEVTGDNAGTYTVKFNQGTREFETYQGDTIVTEAAVVEAVAEVAEVASEAGKTAEEAETASALKGSGTEADPFLVYDYATMQKISDFYNKGYYYFAVAIEKTDNGNIDCRNDWIAVKLNGSFDGKGVKFINLDWKLFGNLVPDSYIKNLDIVNCYIRNTGSVAALANYFQGNTLIENVNISGYIEGQGQTAGYASYCSSSTALITFKDCTLTAKVVAIGGTVGGFMVNPYALANQTGDNLGFVIDNSYIEGHLYSTVSGTGLANVPTYCGYVYAHTITVPVQFKNIDPAKASLCYVEKSASHNNSYWLTNERSHLITVANPTLNLSGVEFGETFSLNVSNDVSYATISFLISPNDHNNQGSYTSTYLTETVNAEAGTITSEIVKKYNVAINGSIDGTTQNQVTTVKTGIASDGKTYNVVNSSYGYTHNGVSIFIVLYSASGDVLAYTNAGYIAAND